jgi:hypothetical protein
VIAAVGRVLAPPIALRTGEKEPLYRGSDDLTTLTTKNHGQLVGQRGLPGSGSAVNGNPRRVPERDRSDRLDQSTEQLVARAVVNDTDWPTPSELLREAPFIARPASRLVPPARHNLDAGGGLDARTSGVLKLLA